jgi:hypothetical protein
MPDKPERDVKLPDPVEMSRMMSHIAKRPWRSGIPTRSIWARRFSI